jgi:hypothetical protein
VFTAKTISLQVFSYKYTFLSVDLLKVRDNIPNSELEFFSSDTLVLKTPIDLCVAIQMKTFLYTITSRKTLNFYHVERESTELRIAQK